MPSNFTWRCPECPGQARRRERRPPGVAPGSSLFLPSLLHFASFAVVRASGCCGATSLGEATEPPTSLSPPQTHTISPPPLSFHCAEQERPSCRVALGSCLRRPAPEGTLGRTACPAPVSRPFGRRPCLSARDGIAHLGFLLLAAALRPTPHLDQVRASERSLPGYASCARPLSPRLPGPCNPAVGWSRALSRGTGTGRGKEGVPLRATLRFRGEITLGGGLVTGPSLPSLESNRPREEASRRWRRG